MPPKKLPPVKKAFDMEKLSHCARSPRYSMPTDSRFKTFKTSGGHLAPGQYKTYRQQVMKPGDEYNPEKTIAECMPKYSFPHTGKDGPGGLMSALGGTSSMPDMGPSKYPAELYQTMDGRPRAHCLSRSSRQPAYSQGKESKFFTVGETPSNAYKKSLGPGSYSLPDGFSMTPEAERARLRALRELKKHGEHWAAGEFSKMYIRDARRGPGYTKEYAPSKEQLKAIEAMVGGK